MPDCANLISVLHPCSPTSPPALVFYATSIMSLSYTSYHLPIPVPTQRGGQVLRSNSQNANTVLHAAARSGSVETVQFVLDYMQQYSTVAGKADPMVDVNVQNDAGATPLELAALEGNCLATPMYLCVQ